MLHQQCRETGHARTGKKKALTPAQQSPLDHAPGPGQTKPLGLAFKSPGSSPTSLSGFKERLVAQEKSAQEAKSKESQVEKKAEPIAEDKVRAAWAEYGLKLKEQNANPIHQLIMKSAALSLTGPDSLSVNLNNPLESQQFEQLKQGLLPFLKETLQNHRLELTKTVKETNTAWRPYTDDDKLKYLAEKYPVLSQLREALGLEPDNS